MIKNILNTFFTRLAASFTSLVVAIIISNVYGAEVKGEQGIILTTITLVTLVTALIGSGSLVYLTPRIRSVHLIFPSYCWNAIVCIVVYFMLKRFMFIPEEYIIHTCLLTFIVTITHIHIGVLIGNEKIRQSNYVNLFNTIGVLIALLINVFIFKYATVLAYIYSLYTGYVLSFIISIWYLVKNRTSIFGITRLQPSSFFSATISLLRYGFLNQLDVVAQMLSFRLSYYFIDYFISKSAVGIYSNAISIVESIWLISRSISMVQNARIANTTDINYSLRITITLIKVSFTLVFFAIVILVLIPSAFYQFLFGPEFGDVRKVIVSISPGVLLFSVTFILSGLFSGTGKYIYNSIASIVGLFVTVLLALLLVPSYGIIGAGITASVSYIVSVSVKLFFFFRNYKISYTQLIPRKEDFKMLLEMIRQLRLTSPVMKQPPVSDFQDQG